MRLYITQEKWDAVKNLNFSDRMVFNEMVKQWSENIFDNFEGIQQTVITFPGTLSTVERYNFHKLSIDGFKTLSYDDQFENRVMEITLSRTYMQDIFRDYIFTIVQEPIQEPPSERKILFDSLVTFMDTHLNEEFQTYLKTI
jgi:hypothetical protein